MTYERPKETDEDYVDIYCCRNPFCVHRLQHVKKGYPPRVHCGIQPRYISTLTRRHWKQIIDKNRIAIKAITARIEAAKILKGRRDDTRAGTQV